jgi:DNA-binding FadR family transcriptional regulator
VRRIIEPPAIKLAIEKITLDEIRKLEENVSYCEGMLNGMGQQIDDQQFFALDDRNNDFHRLIAEGTHNPILSLTVDYVFDFLKGCK